VIEILALFISIIWLAITFVIAGIRIIFVLIFNGIEILSLSILWICRTIGSLFRKDSDEYTEN